MQACLLFYAKGVAEKAAEGAAVQDVAIAVPPFFGPAQRQAIIDAAEIAGEHLCTACATCGYQVTIVAQLSLFMLVWRMLRASAISLAEGWRALVRRTECPYPGQHPCGGCIAIWLLSEF